ncbi:MAG: DegT/DnrJ/EryC1/StrS family aminotransferase [Acidobacteria bacterium]|nr:DegT/DnrJ/EryC1/StrS family aminotransferase [Acidobacteriota bacterium]MCL5289210.1 DegT/DnrJ/EryC1/StrS family aminotransferase [Acidobacteriota bacterium]
MRQLEQEFAARHGFAGGVATGFGRAALRLGLETAGARGGEVLVPDFVCAQVPEAVRRAGATPVFYPVAEDLSVSQEAFLCAITPATRAVLAVHYFGRTLDSIALLAEICRGHRIPLIEDCALSLGAPSIGLHGDAAVFSFTKADWCYGGGLLVSRSKESLERARAIRDSSFQSSPGLAFRYGLLRRADFAANRHSRARAAEFCGRTLEFASGFHQRGFYDSGKYDTLMPAFAARRACRMLSYLPDGTAKRRRILESICESLGPAQRLLFWPQGGAQDASSFLLIHSEAGQAFAWRERAARAGVTLRLCWPAYQDAEPGQAHAALDWLAEHLLLMEIHPKLTEREVQRIVRCLKLLAS